MRSRLEQSRQSRARHAARSAPIRVDARNIVAELDLGKCLSAAEYGKRFPAARTHLAQLSRAKPFRDVAVAIVFEGNDAAGRAEPFGALRALSTCNRTASCLSLRRPKRSARNPTCGAYWRHIPRKGQFTILTSSWYGQRLERRSSDSQRSRIGCVRIVRSSSSRLRSFSELELWWSSSGWPSARTNSWLAPSAREDAV